MKKLLLAGAVALFGAVNAQLQKGGWEVGGTTTLGFNNLTTKIEVKGQGSGDGPKFTALTLTPSAKYFVMDDLSVGLDLSLASVSAKFNQLDYNVKASSTTFSLMPSARYYFYNEGKFIPYINGGIGFATTKVKVTNDGETQTETANGFAWKFGGGVNYMVNKNAGINFGIGYDQNILNSDGSYDGETYDTTTTTGNFGINVGLTIYLGGKSAKTTTTN